MFAFINLMPIFDVYKTKKHFNIMVVSVFGKKRKGVNYFLIEKKNELGYRIICVGKIGAKTIKEVKSIEWLSYSRVIVEYLSGSWEDFDLSEYDIVNIVNVKKNKK